MIKDKKTVLTVFGTRPEAIKMAPLINRIKQSTEINLKVCVTAQHREMLDMVLNIFSITPDYDLDLMASKQSVTEITCRVISGMESVIKKVNPNIILVHGDTTTTFASALAGFYQKIPVGHVEAGLRTDNIYSPYPEEMNRRLTSMISTYHFAPTIGNRNNLIKNGVDEQNIYVTGNTVIDALYMVIKEDYFFPISLLNQIDYDNNRVILLTAHRRENWGSKMQDIFHAVRIIVESYPDVVVVFPVHLNPIVKNDAKAILGDHPRIHLISPLDYAPFVNLMNKSHLVLTDSGGIQEEAPALGKPVLVLRAETERPEAVEAGTVRMAGIVKDDIVKHCSRLLEDEGEYKKMACAVNPYGDGHASERITDALLKDILFTLRRKM